MPVGEVVEPLITMPGGVIDLWGQASEKEERGDTAVHLEAHQGDIDSIANYGHVIVYFPPGEVRLTADMGNAEIAEVVDLKAGDQIEKTLVLNVGLLVPTYYYSEGGETLAENAGTLTILDGKTALDGSREGHGTYYGHGNPIALAAGDYLLRVEQEAAIVELPVTITAGDRADVSVNLDAGLVAIQAPGADTIALLKAKKRIDGTHEEIYHVYYNEAPTMTAPAGDFIVERVLSGDRGRAFYKISVTAGERTELTIPETEVNDITSLPE